MPLSPGQQAILETQTLIARADREQTSVLEAWHNEHHVGAYRHCDQQPCHVATHRQRA